ncbi:MAG: chromate transporter [Treponema sp.]|nr:chromate transporter [Spirochaetia bacterium]MDY2824251.1 chromate transporter [Treponema sp.]MDY4768203.1 chromate transporter [Treponema sp.]
MNIFLELLISFVKIGFLTIGGGYVMLPMMQSELIDKKHWITEEELLDYYAVGQSTPGIIAVNVATFVGYKKAGVTGGIVATLGIISPSLIIITALAGVIQSIDQYPNVQKAMSGINVAVCALITDATLNFIKKGVKNFVTLLVLLASFLLIYYVKVPSYLIVLGAAFLGTITYFVKNKMKKNVGAEAEDDK